MKTFFLWIGLLSISAIGYFGTLIGVMQLLIWQDDWLNGAIYLLGGIYFIITEMYFEKKLNEKAYGSGGQSETKERNDATEK